VTVVTVGTIESFRLLSTAGEIMAKILLKSWKDYRPLQRWSSQKASVDFITHALQLTWY